MQIDYRNTHVNKSSKLFSLSLKDVLDFAAISHSIFGRQEFRKFAESFKTWLLTAFDFVDWLNPFIDAPKKYISLI